MEIGNINDIVHKTYLSYSQQVLIVDNLIIYIKK